jgi:hypothetical protein
VNINIFNCQDINTIMSPEEWLEMEALKKAINDYPGSVVPEKLERFTELFVKSLSYVKDKDLTHSI